MDKQEVEAGCDPGRVQISRKENPLTCTLLTYHSFLQVRLRISNKPMLDNSDPDSAVTILADFVAYDGAFDRCGSLFDWVMQQTNNKTDHGRKLKLSRQAQVKT